MDCALDRCSIRDSCRDREREEKRAGAENIAIGDRADRRWDRESARATTRLPGVGIARGAEISMPRGKRSGGVMHTHRVGLDS